MRYLMIFVLPALVLFKCTGHAEPAGPWVSQICSDYFDLGFKAGRDSVKPHAVTTTAAKTVIKPKFDACKTVIEDLRQLAWDDPDAFDLDNLNETGTVEYMCPKTDKPEGRLKVLCQIAVNERCK